MAGECLKPWPLQPKSAWRPWYSGIGTEHGLVVRGDVVDSRVPAHRQPVLHDREAVGDQLGVPHDLLGVGALVVLVGVDHLAVRGEADDRQVPGLGPHVRAGWADR